MAKLPRGRYSQEFKVRAVSMVMDDGIGVTETARRLSISSKTLANWVVQYKKDDKSLKSPSGIDEREAENSRLRKENAQLRMERDILKKAAVYFAKESL